MNFHPITKLWHPALSLLLSFATSAGAHVGDRVYPIAYLSDEMLSEIRLDDQSVDEWYELLGEPTMTLLDFREELEGSALDPADLDFRIWLAWHDEPARLYVAFVASDDVYKNGHDYSVDWATSSRDNMYNYDSIMLAFDGDHSGGAGCTGCSEEEWLDLSGQTQRYAAIAHTNGPNLDDFATRFYTGSFAWTSLPPYGEGGGGVAGEAPTISVIELYVTPFDKKGETWDSLEDVVVSDLGAGKIIGFTIAVHDYDPPDNFWMLWRPEATSDTDLDTWIDILGHKADHYFDGILLPELDEPKVSAISSDSWGRIKAALEIE